MNQSLPCYFLPGFWIPVNCLQTTVESSTFQSESQTGTQELLRQIFPLFPHSWSHHQPHNHHHDACRWVVLWIKCKKKWIVLFPKGHTIIVLLEQQRLTIAGLVLLQNVYTVYLITQSNSKQEYSQPWITSFSLITLLVGEKLCHIM